MLSLSVKFKYNFKFWFKMVKLNGEKGKIICYQEEFFLVGLATDQIIDIVILTVQFKGKVPMNETSNHLFISSSFLSRNQYY